MLIRTLGLMNNLLVYILPGLFNAFHLLILTTYFKHLPQDYEEAAKIDGASDLTVFFRIVLPLSAPIIATVALFSAVGHWNSWFDALLYVTRSRLLPLQMVLQMIIRGAQTVQLMTRAQYGMAEAKSASFTVESVRAATICFAVIPILCVYPFLQQYFVKGIMIGGLKG